jgi:hypothetical protein
MALTVSLGPLWAAQDAKDENETVKPPPCWIMG